jgi:hypothetical protein
MSKQQNEKLLADLAEAKRLLRLVQELNAEGKITFNDEAYHVICDIAAFLE